MNIRRAQGLIVVLMIGLLIVGASDRMQMAELEDINQQLHDLHRELMDDYRSLLLDVERLQQDNLELQRRLDEKASILEWQEIDVEMTAYAPLDPEAVEGMCYAGDPNVTASGERVEIGTTIAAGPGLPFGTRVYIPGYGYRVVQDRGGAIGNGNIDLAVASRAEAYEIGRQRVTVYMERQTK